MFYNSSNYGGILQSYALVRLVEKEGNSVEQIRYNQSSIYNVKLRLKQAILPYYRMIRDYNNGILYWRLRKRRKIVIRAAKELVNHSKKVYSEQSLSSCLRKYNCFITGSDQVWHGEWPAYFLNFVPSKYKKIAFAASTGKSELTDDEIKVIRDYTKDYTAISVREKDTATQLNKQIKNVECVLDPTLLLEKGDWETIVAERKIDKPYIFCYFLGSNKKMRDLASEFAAKRNCPIVTIPHMQGIIEKNDLLFGEVQSFDARPQDFLSYIKYAEAVFTDSFHACVFSQIFKKQYYVFGRLEHKEMNNRIVSLTEMFGTRNHYIEEQDQYKFSYIDEIDLIDYRVTSEDYKEMKEKSISYLFSNLRK